MTNHKGTREETNLTRWLQDHGWPFAKRKPKAGRRDEGDVTLGDGYPVCIESKAVKAWSPAGWIKELEAEVENARAHTGAVVIKRVGKTDPGEYYVLMPMKYYNDLLLKVYQPDYQAKRRPGKRIVRTKQDPVA